MEAELGWGGYIPAVASASVRQLMPTNSKKNSKKAISH